MYLSFITICIQIVRLIKIASWLKFYYIFMLVTKVHGDHGYPVSSPNMEPIFVASGPSFKRAFQSQSFTNLDVYPLLCHMLGLAAGPHNGSLEDIRSILAQPTSVSLIQPLIIALG